MGKLFRLIFKKLISLVNIWEYIDYETADSSIRKNIAFKGPNVIILACAIIIASVGLNVNSIPVIIGAMLISPVMGPILGFGLGLGTEDNILMKDSLKNFFVMVAISIIASSIYFRLSPLNLENQSELLARTNPTIYDVLIALFGGFAGILETSRKEKGTVISGVAIATALMPPLCTVGYGISVLEFKFIGGALYLFLINSIFIALATFMAVKLFKFPKFERVNEKRRRFSKGWYILILVVVIAPSIYTAINVVRENNFKIVVAELVKKNETMGDSFIIKYDVDYHWNDSKIKIVVAGGAVNESDLARLYKDAEELGIMRSQIEIEAKYSQNEDILQTLVENQGERLAEKIKEVENLEKKNEQLSLRNEELDNKNDELKQRLDGYDESIPGEVKALYPFIESVVIARGQDDVGNQEVKIEKIIALINSREPIDVDIADRIENWLKIRLNSNNVLIRIDAPTYENDITGEEY